VPPTARCTFQMSSLCDRRRQLCKPLLRQIVRDESYVLHYLLPTKLDSVFTDRLRSAKTFPLLHTRTTRYRNSFFSICAHQFTIGPRETFSTSVHHVWMSHSLPCIICIMCVCKINTSRKHYSDLGFLVSLDVRPVVY